jgi:hypothetical protein
VVAHRAMTDYVKQAQSPLSFIRLDAYVGISNFIETNLDTASKRMPMIASLTRHSQGIAIAATAALDNSSSPPGKGAHSNSNSRREEREVTESELIALLSVLQASCLLSHASKSAALAVGAPAAILRRLPTCHTAPKLANALLDTLLAIQLDHSDAFKHIIGPLKGIRLCCSLILDKETCDGVKAHSARFLNIVLSQIGPALTERDENTAHMAESAAALMSAQEAVGEMLGRDIRSILTRKINLADADAEQKLDQLAGALSLFVQTPLPSSSSSYD